MTLEPLPNASYDLIIVGSGIVGTILAVALQKTGAKIAIIEERPLEVVIDRRQAYALSLMSGRILKGLGVWDKIFPNIGKFRHIRLSDADYRVFVPFAVNDLKTDYLGYVGEHRVILSALIEATRERSNIHWICPARVKKVEYGENNATVTIERDGQTYPLTARLVVGADGARSFIRQEAKITTKGWKYWQSCVAFTIAHQQEYNETAFERFWPTGPMGILPLPGNRCQIVWTNPHAEAKKLQEMEESQFIARLEEYTGGLLGKLQLASERSLFPVQLMQSDTYIKPRLALVGDAAHCCHPVGGQGLNLGIRDAASLSQVLTEAIEKGEDIGSIEVLKRYEKWRKKENLVILGFTDFLDRFFSTNWLPIVWTRRFGLFVMRHVPPVKLFALQLMTGLRGRIPELAKP
ncbi:FAD-dependent hydroxylase [Pannus brasiliensis CCIBt3594]|uniref:FAD-dependent hydroxylase n=1 Tax=Pannus brasiliensis CCIBt3594 TaxID=1427578 RepID=A0AAW9QQP5_9CHRO